MDKTEARVLDAIDERAVAATLVDIVRVPSITGTAAESDLQHLCAARLRAHDMDVDAWKLDLDALRACAAALPGRHDFTAFTPSQSEHKTFDREVFSASWERTGEEIVEFRIEANAFLRNMNRVLVATMLDL